MENLEKKVAAAEVAMLKCEQENQAKLARSEESRVKDNQQFEERRLRGLKDLRHLLEQDFAEERETWRLKIVAVNEGIVKDAQEFEERRHRELEDLRVSNETTQKVLFKGFAEREDSRTKEAGAQKRSEWKRKYYGTERMCKQHGWDNAFGKRKEKGWAAALTGRVTRKDSDLFDAALGFWLGSQKEGVEGKEGRAGKEFRKELLYDLVRYGHQGELWERITREVQLDGRASAAVIARIQDTDSTFNGRALQSIRQCLPGYEKGKRNVCLPCQSSVNIPKERVQLAAKEAFGSEFPTEYNGELWRWNMKRGVHMYLKRKYYDLKHDDHGTPGSPWLVTATGDAVRVSQRHAQVTVCGLKIVDKEHPEQQGTGKVMNQSPFMYTPTICSLTGLTLSLTTLTLTLLTLSLLIPTLTSGEDECMPSFHEMLRELEKIEEDKFITVDGQNLPLHIKVNLVGDKAFMWKCVGRGCGSANGQFCWMCKVSARHRHRGQPGGCQSCKRDGVVYGSDGTQWCTHHAIVSQDRLQLDKDRLEWLVTNVKPKMPLHVRPLWRDKAELLEECLLRCDAGEQRDEVNKMKMGALENFLLTKTSTG